MVPAWRRKRIKAQPWRKIPAEIKRYSMPLYLYPRDKHTRPVGLLAGAYIPYTHPRRILNSARLRGCTQGTKPTAYRSIHLSPLTHFSPCIRVCPPARVALHKETAGASAEGISLGRWSEGQREKVLGLAMDFKIIGI